MDRRYNKEKVTCVFRKREMVLYTTNKTERGTTDMKENRKLLKEVLRDIRHDMTDEEVLNLLADSKISVSPESGKEKYTLGQRAADAIAKFAGSWAFIFSFTGGLVLWMVINTLMAAQAFDPYPFILLNLVLSCIAAIQAPLIMMSQNRQEEKDRRRAENDYKVNLKTEIMIEDLYDKVNAILAKQSELEKQLQTDHWAEEESMKAHKAE
jgi:predicted membrane protein